MEEITIFAERLKEIMDERGFNTLTLEKASGISNSTISNWLNKKYLPNTAKLIKISSSLECPIDFLLGRTEVIVTKNIILESKFTERLKAVAKQKDKTLHGVAVDLKIADATLYNWGNGKYTPGIPGLILLAEYFGCSVDYLIGRKD